MTEHWVEARDGTRLFVEERGLAENDAIIFAHEFGGDMGTWDDTIAALSQDFRCVRYAARGVHPSEIPVDAAHYGQDKATSDLLDVAAALELPEFHLAGCSMGSFTSLMAASHARESILSLTLIGCSTGPRDAFETHAYHDALGRELALLESKAGSGAVEWFSNDSAYARMPEKQPDLWKAYLERLAHQSVQGARNILETVHWNRRCLSTMRTRLQNIPAPVLIFYGEEDHPLVLETAPFLEDCLRTSTVIAVPGTGHLLHLEEPKLFLDGFRKLASKSRRQPKVGDN